MQAGDSSGVERPRCACHGEPMVRRNDRRRAWRCSVSSRAAGKRWRAANPDKVSARNARSNPRRVLMSVGLGLQIYLGVEHNPETRDFAKQLIRDRQEEVNARVHP